MKKAKLYTSLEHKNIIVYKEVFFDDKKTLYIVIENLDGCYLIQKIAEYRDNGIHFSEEEIWSTLIQILEGLKYLHQNCIIPKNIKSENIFLAENGCVKIGELLFFINYIHPIKDYGWYLSPEIFNEQLYNYKCNIWSSGCIIYEMCALIPPFREKNISQLVKKIISGIYQQIPDQYSDDLRNIIKQMLVVDPKNRPSASELLENPIIKKKIVEFGIYNKNNNENKIPINMPQINKELPQKKYEKEKSQLINLFYNKPKIKLKEEKNKNDNQDINQNDEKSNNKDLDQKGKKTILNKEKKNKHDSKDMKLKDIEKNKNDIKYIQKDEEKNNNENRRKKDIEINLYEEENKKNLLNEKILQLEKELNEEKEKHLKEININKELNDKIIKLTDELINEKQNVQNLKDKLNSLNNKNLKLEELIDTQIKEIFELKSKVISEEKVLAISLSSIDENINFILPCKSNEQFIKIEEKFYKEYPEYGDKNIHFIVSGNEIKRFKTLKENNIKSGSIINIYYFGQ